MILKASQRAGGKQLAIHLLRDDENDHVEIHEVRGFTASDVVGALREAYAVSRGTKCTQYLFSVSLSPPQEEKVDIPTFMRAVDHLEERVGLSGQPRVIVFHEKNGRRHAHCVWSRIRANDLTAVNLPFFKRKLRDLSRELFIENGWSMPRGLANSEEKNPLNFSREEWQQAKRINRDPKTIKAIFQDCWAISDSRQAFAQALEARGYYLAKGDRRSFVAVDHTGEVYAIARWAGIKTKEVAARLGDPDQLPAIEEVKQRIANQVAEKLTRFAQEAKSEFETARLGLQERKKKLVTWQRDERTTLWEFQAARASTEAQTRQQRFRRGLRGLWDRITGRHATIARQNAAEYEAARQRDEAERQALIDRQLADRRALHRQIADHQARLDKELASLQVSQVPPIKQEVRPDPILAERTLRTRRRRSAEIAPL